MSVITWTIGGGTVMFIIGLISAFGSRRQRKTMQSLRRDAIRLSELAGFAELTREEQERLYALLALREKKDDEPRTVMSMVAGGGDLNGKDNLASVGNSPR